MPIFGGVLMSILGLETPSGALSLNIPHSEPCVDRKLPPTAKTQAGNSAAYRVPADIEAVEPDRRCHFISYTCS